jgi:uncharacterized Zn-finger protein
MMPRISVTQPQLCRLPMMYFWPATKNFASLIAPMPQMMFSTPATSSRIPANIHQPVALSSIRAIATSQVGAARTAGRCL